MTTKDKLFALLQSLSPTERAYFKKFAKINTQHEQPDYLRLFEAVEKQLLAQKKTIEKIYDEYKIKQQFKGE